MEETSIVLDDVWVEYCIYGIGSRSFKKTVVKTISGGRMAKEATEERTRVLALKGINLSIKGGERVGLIGSNGSGKTTMLRVMAGALKPASGRIRRVGSTSSLFDISLGMNSEANGWDNIVLRGMFLGLSAREAKAKTDEIVDFCDLTPEQLSRPVRTYSSGMLMKLAFAISTSVQPEILLLDEWIGVGDAAFFARAQSRMTDLVESARILVIASHYEQHISTLCTKALYLREGEMAAYGPVDEVLELYRSATQAAVA